MGYTRKSWRQEGAKIETEVDTTASKMGCNEQFAIILSIQSGKLLLPAISRPWRLELDLFLYVGTHCHRVLKLGEVLPGDFHTFTRPRPFHSVGYCSKVISAAASLRAGMGTAHAHHMAGV